MKGAIFDVDGTILDSMGLWLDITNAFFAEHGIEIPPAKTLEYQSMTLEESLPQIRQEYLPDMSVEDMFAEFMHRTDEAYRNTIPAKAGVCEYMHSLYNNGVKIAVATSGFKELCRAALKRIGVFDIVSEYAFSAEVGCDKSNPDIYLLAAHRLGLEPSECTVFEDIITGVISAKTAGFSVVAVEDISNARDKQRLIRHSDRYITGWDELLGNINNRHG